jgi:hypothetical protein
MASARSGVLRDAENADERGIHGADKNEMNRAAS